MKKIFPIQIFALLSMVTLGITSWAGDSQKVKAVNIQFKTTAGNIVVEVYPDKAPISANHFLRLVDSGIYDGTEFYAAARRSNMPKMKMESGKEWAIKSGGFILGGLGYQDTSIATIKHESTQLTGFKHREGTLSFGRGQHGMASVEIFICIEDQPQFDFSGESNEDGQGYAVFGQVVKGMDVVRAIHQLPTRGRVEEDLVLNIDDTLEKKTSILGRHWLDKPIKIIRVIRL